jgi:hypothetical protein
MNPELVKWIVVAIASCTATVIGAVVWLAVLVFKIGQKYGAVETELATIHEAGRKMEKANEKLDRVPLIETKLDMLADAVAEERRRFASEFPDMQQKVTTLWERVFSLQNWRKSQGQYGE